MTDTAQLHDAIEAALAAINYPAQPEGLYAPIAYTLAAGGKRLRPTLLLLAYSLYRDDWTRALPAAVGLEVYHNHTLLHDDLMDRAQLRRGRPTVHTRWDDNTAVLSGDAMLILAFRHVLRAEATPDVQARALDLLARTAQEICEGQQMDMDFERRDDVTEAEYLEMIRLKTSVLLGCAARMGAQLAGAPDADADALYAFAEQIGLAFQLQDDYLDLYGDPAVFGKRIGGDILQGKKTYLLFAALRGADPEARTALLRLLADGSLPPQEKVAAVRQRYDALRAPERTQEAIARCYQAARQRLQAVSLPATRTEPLRRYADSLLGRKN